MDGAAFCWNRTRSFSSVSRKITAELMARSSSMRHYLQSMAKRPFIAFAWMIRCQTGARDSEASAAMSSFPTKPTCQKSKSHIIEDRIESISFHSLVARYKPPRIDLIVIDTEGYDFEILRQLDLIRFRPDLIVYEHKHLNELERTIAADLLIANGYSVQSTAWANTVAMRR